MIGNKKIALLLGRGIEGCGVTKNAVEFNNYHKNSKIFAVDDKRWPRKKSMHIVADSFMCSDEDSIKKVADEINDSYDAVVVYSVPSLKHSEECVDNFVRLLNMLQPPKSLVQVDHNSASIARNAKLVEVCNSVDILMTHSLEGNFAKWCDKNGVNTPLVSMGVGFDYDAHRAKYWKPVDELNARTLKWIGRCAMWKGPNLLVDFHNKYLREHGFITTLEGLEASIQSLLVRYEDGFDKTIPRDVLSFISSSERKKMKHGSEVAFTPPYLYPDYVHDDCMQRLSRCQFGSDLYNLKAELYGNNIEYCHAEVIASGTVPLFHKHFGDNIVHRVTGDPASHGFSGTLWYDANNQQDLADMMIKLSSDNIMLDEWRERAFTFWKEHSDAPIVYDDIITKTLDAKSISKKVTVQDFFA